jgi:hypothetical protein
VIASWLNDWDLKEQQSLDMYVEEGGRKFLRHYLLDFGASLGADTDPTEYYHGREYGLDSSALLKEIFTLGLHESANEKHARIISPEIGNFTTDDFDPKHWKQTYPAIVFDNLTNFDAFWATRVILSFTEQDLRSIVETGEYSDPRTVDYIVRTLLERRQMVARAWLREVDALDDFKLQPAPGGLVMTFRDLMLDNTLALADLSEYTYQIRGPHYKSEKKRTGRLEIQLDRAALGATIEHGAANTPVEVTIWTNRRDGVSEPVTIYLDWSPTRDSVTIRRIARG